MELLFSRIKNNKTAFLGLAVLVVGVFVAVLASRQPTQINQKASVITNLNSGGNSIGKTNNPDGTMGPASYAGNFSSTLSQSQTGTMILTVSDPPSLPADIKPQNSSPKFSSLIVQIKKVEVHSETNHWETLNMPSPMSVDLAQLARGAVASLGQTILAGGKYTEIRMYLQNATATLNDGTNVTLTIQGKDRIIRIVEPFNVSRGKNTTLVVDFDAQNSVVQNGNTYTLKPVVSKFLTTR